MLPDRSKRFALTEDGGLPRLKLTENWQLLLIALIMLGLFVVIFPRQALVQKLYTERKFDELTLFYIDNLRRTEPDNPDIAILLARAREQQLDVASAERLLLPVMAQGSEVQRRESRHVLIEHYGQALHKTQDATALQGLRGKLRAMLAVLPQEPLPPAESRFLARAAFQVEQPRLALSFLQRGLAGNNASAPGEVAGLLAEQARLALGQGRYELAAECFLLARQQSSNRDEARELFRQGIAALMANSQYDQALQAADQHLGDLAADPVTLRYLMRAALSAGVPQRAADYARRLVFGEESVAAARL